MNYPDVGLYKELVAFCNSHKKEIESKFEINLEFNEFHERCFIEMYLNNKANEEPLKPILLKEKVDGLTEVYKKAGGHFWNARNKMIKGLDIQKGQWFEKAFQMFLKEKNITVVKKGFPFPDYEVQENGEPKAYYELKYIESPFLSANSQIKNPFPYKISRWDYEASLTLDTGEKLMTQRNKIEQDIISKGQPVFYLWWFDSPHLKGLFYMHAQDVFKYWDNVGNLHERKEREGDLIDKQEKGKIYPPLLKMNSISEFLNDIK